MADEHEGGWRGWPDRAWLLLFSLLYALCAWLLYAHLSLLDSHELPLCGCRDIVNEVWFLEFEHVSFAAGHLPFWTDLIDYPTGINSVGSAAFPLLGLLASPLTAAVGPVAALNFLLRLGLWLSALSAFLVLRRVLRSSLASGVGGLIYGFSPYTVHAAQTHMFLAFVPLPPVILYLLYRQLVARRGRPWRTGVVIGVLLAVQYLIDAEIAASVVTIAVALMLVFLLVNAIRGRVRGAVVRDAAKVMGTALAVAIILLAYPLWQVLEGRQHLHAPTQPIAGPGWPAITTILAPVNSSGLDGIANLASRWAWWSTRYTGLLGGSGYLGVVLIAALVWIAARNRGRPLVPVAVTMGVVAWLLALGPYLATATGNTSVPWIFQLFTHVPLLWSMVAGRFTLYMWLAVAAIVAVAVDRLSDELPARASVLVVTLAAAGLVLAAPSNRIRAATFVPVRPFLSRRIQSQIPTGGVVLTYPYVDIDYNQAMLWQALDRMRFKLIGGYGNYPYPSATELWAPPLSPKAVPCFFMQELEPAADWHRNPQDGCPASGVTATPRELRAFVRRHDIAAIVVRRQGTDPGRVVRLVKRAFGRPVASGPFLAWKVRH